MSIYYTNQYFVVKRFSLRLFMYLLYIQVHLRGLFSLGESPQLFFTVFKKLKMSTIVIKQKQRYCRSSTGLHRWRQRDCSL